MGPLRKFGRGPRDRGFFFEQDRFLLSELLDDRHLSQKILSRIEIFHRDLYCLDCNWWCGVPHDSTVSTGRGPTENRKADWIAETERIRLSRWK